jgi:hypothetical protein
MKRMHNFESIVTKIEIFSSNKINSVILSNFFAGFSEKNCKNLLNKIQAKHCFGVVWVIPP